MGKSMITVLWHVDDSFYNVRFKVGMMDASRSLMKMRYKVYNVKDVDWKFHVVLTFSDEALEKVKKNGGVDSKVLTSFLQRLRKRFPLERHLWKYEEGGEKGRPHFHMMFDFKRVVEMKELGKWLEEAKKIERIDLKSMVKNEKRYEMNSKKTDKEIVLGAWLKEVWEKGITYAREIKGEIDLHAHVEKDVAKSTTGVFLKGKAKKWGFSRGMNFLEKPKKELGESEYEWVGNHSPEEAREFVVKTKPEFIDHFNELGKSGEHIYSVTILDILRVGGKVVKQKSLDDEDFEVSDVMKAIMPEELVDDVVGVEKGMTLEERLNDARETLEAL